MKKHLSAFYSTRPCLAVAVVLFTVSAATAQGTAGFSGQTQPSRLVETQFISKASYDGAHNKAGRSDLMKVDAAHVAVVAAGDVAISKEAKILSEYDDLSHKVEARRGLGDFIVGVVSDGDFNQNTAAGTTGKAKAGSLGLDAVWLKTIYHTRTYYHYKASTAGQPLAVRRREAADSLVGEEVISQPLWAFNALAVLLSGTEALGTNVKAGAARNAVATQTQQRAFGQALLIPNGYVSGAGLAVTANVAYNFGLLQPNWTIFKNLGLMANLGVAQTTWTTRDTATVVNIFAPSLGLNYRLVEARFNMGEQANYVLVQPFVRATMRHLFGDVQNQPLLLHDALGSTERDFFGYDVGVTATVNAIRFTFNVPVFNGATIAGFTQGQTVLGFGIAATFPLKNFSE